MWMFALCLAAEPPAPATLTPEAPAAAPAEPPPAATLAPVEPAPKRTTHSGPVIGATQLFVGGPGGSGTDVGLVLAVRGETALSEALQLNLQWSMGVTRPQRTVAVARFAIDIGAWAVNGFRDVSAWVERGEGTDTEGLRTMGAIFAYMGLGMTFVAVPVVLAASPFASIGHTVAGPTVSWHTDRIAPNLFIELGVGGTLYGDPIDRLPALGWGPIVGVGGQVGRQSVLLRALIAPDDLRLDGRDDARDTLVVGELAVGF